MGSSGSLAPKPPDPYETSEKSIQAQIDALPKILEAQQKYGGQFSETELDLLRQYGPQYANLQNQLSDITAPQARAAQGLLTQEFQRPMSELLTQDEVAQFQADSRAATSARGLGESGFGALDEIRGLTALRQQIKAQRLNLALGATGGLPAATSFTNQGQVSQGQMVQNVQPSQIFGLAQSNYATEGSIYGAKVGILGEALGGALGGIGYAMQGKFKKAQET